MRIQRLVLAVLAVGLVGAGAAGCGGETKPAVVGPSDLAVTGTPTGEINGPIQVTIGFSRPMVKRDQLDRVVASPPVEISPALPADARWIDEKTLVLAPRGGLPVSTKFAVTVPAGTRAVDGHALAEAHRFEFTTPRLTAELSVLGSEARAARAQPMRVAFNQDVSLEQVIEHCRFTAAGQEVRAKNGPESPAGPARSYTIVPAAELAVDTAWKLACAAGLRGSVGNLGPESAAELAFRTYGPLKFVKLDPSGTDIQPEEGLRLEFSLTNPLAPPYKMTLTPKVAGFPDRCHALDDGELVGLSCVVTLEPQTRYKLVIDGAQQDVFGQALGAPQSIELGTTDAAPAVSVESGYFLAELKRPVLPVWTRNVDEVEVTAVAITPENFHELRPLLDWWEPKPADLSKTKLSPRTRKIKPTGPGFKNKWRQHGLGGAALVGGQDGPGMFYVEIGAEQVDSPPYAELGRAKVLVNFTDIGVVSKLSGSRGLVWATQLSTGKPLPGAQVTVRGPDGKLTWSGTTDGDGVAMLPGTAQLLGKRPGRPARPSREDEDGEGEDGGGGEDVDEGASGLRVFVQSGADWTMVSPTSSNGLSPWNYNVSMEGGSAPVQLRGFMHTDRGLYRPGETVHVKGLARVTRLGSPLEVPGEGKKVLVMVHGPGGKTFHESEAKLSPFGGFWFDLALPGDARLGDYVVSAQLEGGVFTRSFAVEEYRPSTFEVTGKLTDARVVKAGALRGTVSASYFYGAPVRDAPATITVHARSRRVAFAGLDEFEFSDGRRYDGYYDESEHSQNLVTEDTVTLDAKGNAALSVKVGPNDLAYDADLLIDASVTSPSDEVISKTFTAPYFRSRRYFGIHVPGYFAEVGKPQKIRIAAMSPDGKPASGPAKVTISRRDWNCVWEDWGYRGNYQCKDTTQTLLSQTIALGNAPAELPFTPPSGGDYWIVVEGETDKQDAAVAASRFYAWGDGGGSWQSSDSMTLDIVADKKEYRAGDTATLLLKTDLAQATGLVTIERDGVIEKRTIELTPKLKHLTVPITADHAPNVYVSVALVQGRMGDGPRGKPRMRMGIVNLPVRPEDSTLTVAVETDKKDYRPGEQVTATIKVSDRAGQPVSAEVSITASDEGVLSLIGYETPNPIPTFYAPWGLGVTSATQIEYLRDIPGENQQRPAFGGDAAGTVRSRFVSTAVWSPGVVTDAAGVATVTFSAPDNLTAFRVMALAADRGHRFGAADQRFTVAKPLQLHAALPRFLNVGDVLQGGVVVHNETGKAGKATVKLTVDKRLTTASRERTVAVAKGARVPVLFELTAAELGEAVLRFSVAMDGERDAVELKLPVRHPSPVRAERVASGAASAPATIPVAMPAHAIASSVELVISVDRDGLSGIEDGLRELIHYPYGCLEQTTSQVIPMIAVRDLAETMAIDGLRGPALERFVTAGLAKIGRHQTPYGGFSLWPGGEPETYYTAYALWGLHLAKKAGYPVDQARIDDALLYLRNDGAEPSSSRPRFNAHGSAGDQAFALYVRAVLGEKITQDAAAKLAGGGDVLPIYGKAFLARALAAGLGAKDPAVRKLVDELAALADAAGKADALIREPLEREMWSYMSSSARTTALVLAALVELDPKHEAIAPLVRALMKHRRSSDSYDTQANLYSLLALTGYARTRAGKPSSVTVTLAGKPVVAGALAGKQRMRVVSVAMPAAGELAITPTGEVHYHVEVRYRRTVESLAAESKGLALERQYLDEAGAPKTAFTVGDVVSVRVIGELPESMDHLMMSDLLPAGFEPLNERFATTGTAAVPQTHEWGTYRELRDDRVNFATQYSSRGRHVHEFRVRAIAAGTFTRPPAVAERMYEPAVRAQTGLDRIEIKPR